MRREHAKHHPHPARYHPHHGRYHPHPCCDHHAMEGGVPRSSTRPATLMLWMAPWQAVSPTSSAPLSCSTQGVRVRRTYGCPWMVVRTGPGIGQPERRPARRMVWQDGSCWPHRPPREGENRTRAQVRTLNQLFGIVQSKQPQKKNQGPRLESPFSRTPYMGGRLEAPPPPSGAIFTLPEGVHGPLLGPG